MDILRSVFHLYLHNIFEKVQSIRKVIRVQTIIGRFKNKNHHQIVQNLTSSPIHPRVLVFRHSINRSAIVQNPRILPFVACTKPTASIATQLRIVVGSTRNIIENISLQILFKK